MRDAVAARERVALVAIFVVALAVRLVYVLSIRDAVFFTHLQTEPLRYDRWAAAILAGHAPAPPFDEPPGYAYFLAAVHRVLGRTPTAVALAQMVLDATSWRRSRSAGPRSRQPRDWTIGALFAGKSASCSPV